MDRRRLVVGAVVVVLAAFAGAGLAGFGPAPSPDGTADSGTTGPATTVDGGGTPSPAADGTRTASTAAASPGSVRTRQPGPERTPPTSEPGQTTPAPAGPPGGSSGVEGGGPEPPASAPESTGTSGAATARTGVSATATANSTDIQTPVPDPFEVQIGRIESCGRFCRDITASLTNRQSTAATNVVVTTRLYPGNRTDGRPVWTGEVAVGRLGPGATATTSERVELSVFDAVAVSDAGGWVTVSTTIRSDRRTVTVTERRQVA